MQYKHWSMYVVLVFATLGTASVQADDEHRALVVVGQSATVEAGQHVDAAIVIGGDLHVEGTVDGLAAAVGGDLRVGPSGKVFGPTASIGGELSADPAAQIQGPRVHVAGGDFSTVVEKLSESQAPPSAPMWLGPTLRVLQILVLFVVGIFLVLWAPQQVDKVSEAVLRQPARDTLVGLAVVVGFVPFCVLLAVSVLGLPLIPVTFLVLLATFILGLTAVAMVLGRKLGIAVSEPLKAMGLGMLLMAVAAAIPFLGALLLFIASTYAAGAVVSTRFGTRQGPPAGGHLSGTSAPATETPITVEH